MNQDIQALEKLSENFNSNISKLNKYQTQFQGEVAIANELISNNIELSTKINTKLDDIEDAEDVLKDSQFWNSIATITVGIAAGVGCTALTGGLVVAGCV